MEADLDHVNLTMFDPTDFGVVEDTPQKVSLRVSFDPTNAEK